MDGLTVTDPDAQVGCGHCQDGVVSARREVPAARVRMTHGAR